MEFKLNKIDTDLRQKINDATKEGKVHGKESVYVSKDKRENRNKNTCDSQTVIKKGYKNKLLVDAKKVESIGIDGYIDKDDKDISKGIILDIRK